MGGRSPTEVSDMLPQGSPTSPTEETDKQYEDTSKTEKYSPKTASMTCGVDDNECEVIPVPSGFHIVEGTNCTIANNVSTTVTDEDPDGTSEHEKVRVPETPTIDPSNLQNFAQQVQLFQNDLALTMILIDKLITTLRNMKPREQHEALPLLFADITDEELTEEKQRFTTANSPTSPGDFQFEQNITPMMQSPLLMNASESTEFEEIMSPMMQSPSSNASQSAEVAEIMSPMMPSPSSMSASDKVCKKIRWFTLTETSTDTKRRKM